MHETIMERLNSRRVVAATLELRNQPGLQQAPNRPGHFAFATWAFLSALTPAPGETVTFTIPSHVLNFASRAGAIGATVEGYTIEFYDSSGNPLFPGDSVVNSQGALNIYVPAGITCTQPLPVVGGENLGCRFDSEGARYARGPLVTSPNGYFMPITIAYEDYKILFSGGAVGAYGDFYLYGTDDLNSVFRSGPYRMAIQVPVGGE